MEDNTKRIDANEAKDLLHKSFVDNIFDYVSDSIKKSKVIKGTGFYVIEYKLDEAKMMILNNNEILKKKIQDEFEKEGYKITYSRESLYVGKGSFEDKGIIYCINICFKY